MAKSLKRNLKAVSPVIATIIIVAIAIVMAIAVAYWMLGMGGAFTRYEKVEFTSCYATKGTYDPTPENASNGDSVSAFFINLRLKNTGSADATLDLLFFNAIPQQDVGDLLEIKIDGDTLSKTESLDVTIVPGDTKEGTIILKSGGTFNSGMSLELMIQTVAGKQYPKVVVLP